MTKNNLDLVAYCGLYCPKCYKMIVSKAAKDLRDVLKNTHICESNYNPSSRFKKELDKLILLRCPKPCKEGGGNPRCKIKKCCMKKDFVGCWECNDSQICSNLNEQSVNDIKKIKEVGINKFIDEI